MLKHTLAIQCSSRLLARAILAIVTLTGMLLAGCERKAPTTPASDAGSKPTLVATVGMLADPAKVLAGPHVQVQPLLGEGVDPHTYKASPMDLRILTSASTVISVGHNLEGQLGEALTKLQSRTRSVKLGEKLDPSLLIKASEAGKLYDPHVWNDVTLMRTIVEHVRDELVKLAPDHQAEITRNQAAYDAVLVDLDGYLKDLFATIPPSQRVLVTAHDAFGYLGRAYGLEVLAIQGISTESEASLQDINAIVDLVVTRKVPAVFIESSVPRKTIEALIEGCKARGHTVVIGGELFSDSLGPVASQAGTYLGMMVRNAQAITRALGNSEAANAVAMPPALAKAINSGDRK
jgi:manganese/zinc/iron transport system substrate-binding protein